MFLLFWLCTTMHKPLLFLPSLSVTIKTEEQRNFFGKVDKVLVEMDLAPSPRKSHSTSLRMAVPMLQCCWCSRQRGAGEEDLLWEQSQATAQCRVSTQPLAQHGLIWAKPSRQSSSGLATSRTQDIQVRLFKS